MESTFRVLFFLKRDKVKKNGNMPIMTRITIDGKLAQFNTKLEVNPKNWQAKTGKVSGRAGKVSGRGAELFSFDFGIPSAFRPHSEKARPNFRNSSAGLSPKNDRVLNCKVC